MQSSAPQPAGRPQYPARPSKVTPPPATKKGMPRRLATQSPVKPRSNYPQSRTTPRLTAPKKNNPGTSKSKLAKNPPATKQPTTRKTATPPGPLRPPPSPANVHLESSISAKPVKPEARVSTATGRSAADHSVKNTTPVSTAPQRIKLDYRAPAIQAKPEPKIKSPSLEVDPPRKVTKPPPIIAGELVPLEPVDTIKEKKTSAASETKGNSTTTPQTASPEVKPPGKEKPRGKTLAEKATQIAGSLAGAEDGLGLSVEDVLDLTKTEDNLPFIKHEPPSSSQGDINDLIISAIKQTDFDIGSSRMEFSGDVQIKSPRFAMRCDRFIVHLKKDGSGISYGEGVGNVFIRMRNNGKPSGHEGFASHAIYLPEEGKLTLSGWPKIREKQKEHVAATKETKMVLYTDGRVQTLGRNRTIINN